MQNYEHECDKYKEQLFDYVSDVLTDEERAAVELHIGSCEKCAKELEEIRTILGAAAALDEPEIPDGLRAAVSERIMREENAARFKKRRFMRIAQIAVPFAACAVLAIGIYSGGLYDKYMNADNMISTGDNSVQTEEISAVDNTDTEQETDIPDVPVAETPEKETNKKPQSNQAADTTTKSVSEDVAVAENMPAQPDEAPEPVPAEESAEAVNTPIAEATDAVAEYSVIRSVETDMAIPEFAEEAEEMAAGGGGAVSGGGSAAAKVQKAENTPTSCTIITDDPDAFAKGFGKELTDGTFVLVQGEWKAFVEYVRESGAQLDADFSGEYNGQTLVTVKK